MVRFASLARPLRGFAFAMLIVGCGDGEQISYDVCPVPIGDSPRRGPDDAWVTIIEFADYQCSFCRAAEEMITEVDAKHPGLRWVFKNFPLASIHANAEPAASAADCAEAQGKFWEMHDVMMAGERAVLDNDSLEKYAKDLGLDMDAWSSCFMSDESRFRIMTDFTQGEAYDVHGTPAFFINGHGVPGLYPTEDMLVVIGEAEKEAKKSGLLRANYYETLVSRGCSNDESP